MEGLEPRRKGRNQQGQGQRQQGWQTIRQATQEDCREDLALPQMSKHPDDRIFAVKDFINELSKVQNRYFNKLCIRLNLSEELEDDLFDYIFNETRPLTFGEYLDGMGRGNLWEGL